MKLNTNPLKGKYPITVRIAGLCGIFSLVLIFLVITENLKLIPNCWKKIYQVIILM